MFAGFGGGKRTKEGAAALYAALVGQARRPEFYTDFGVPDTVDGRFELICLHAFLLMERFMKEGSAGKKTSQALFDAMFRDMDRSLREMGVGDLSLPKHVRRMMQGFNGRAAQYHKALRSGNPEDMRMALLKNIYGTVGGPRGDRAGAMTDYVYENIRFLDAQGWELLSGGSAAFRMTDAEQDDAYDRQDRTGMVA